MVKKYGKKIYFLKKNKTSERYHEGRDEGCNYICKKRGAYEYANVYDMGMVGFPRRNRSTCSSNHPVLCSRRNVSGHPTGVNYRFRDVRKVHNHKGL
jgi:hypothetical protein